MARINPKGSLDQTFGSGGWTVLPWPGGVSAIAETPSGDIVLGGTEGGGCCYQEWIGEVNAEGGIVSDFGSGGRTRIPGFRDDSGIYRVSVGQDGEIFVLTSGGNMGGWGVTISALSSSGLPLPSFQSNVNAAMTGITPSGVFVGDMDVRSTDILLFGTEQNTPVSNVPDPTAQGRVVAFRLNGELETTFGTGGERTFNSPMAQSVWVLPRSSGGFLMADARPTIQSNPKASAELNLFDFSSDGDLDHTFGHRGMAQLALPFLSQSFPASAVPITAATNGRVSALVMSTANGHGLRLIEILA
ncbi:MAG TPA: hypothetical protein VK428_07790 [Acidimicrobiales bacterium]|nr:hypothetical protein [Acidimicrobiales bacterium]